MHVEDKDEYFVAIAKNAVCTLLDYHSHPETFSQSKFSDDNIKVFTRKSTDDACPEDIVKASTVLHGVTLNQVLALSLPWMQYRTQWDELLSEARILREIKPNMRIVQHLTKKRMPLSARDSVDIVTVENHNGVILICAKSVPLVDVPEEKDHQRTVQHLGAYVFREIGNGDVEFEVYFHGDLKIGGISLLRSIVETVKPKFMVDLTKNLQKAVRRVPVLPGDLEATLVYTDVAVTFD